MSVVSDYYLFSIIYLEKISHLGIGLIESLFQYLDFKSLVYFRLLVSKDVNLMFKPAFANLQVDLKLTKMLPFRDLLGRRRPVSEEDKISYLIKITDAFPNIREMTLFPSWIFYRCGSSLLFLYGMDRLRKSLRRLHVSVMNNQALVLISNFSELTDLDISFSYDITGTGLSHISFLPKLKYLNLEGCKRFYDDDFHFLLPLVNLLSLTLDDTHITDVSLPLLKSFNQLKTLKMNKCLGISDFGMNTLSISAPQLNSLEISQTEIGDEGLRIIALHFKELKHLSISDNDFSITEEGLSHLLLLDGLESLAMDGLNSTIPRGPHSVFDQLSSKVSCCIIDYKV